MQDSEGDKEGALSHVERAEFQAPPQTATLVNSQNLAMAGPAGHIYPVLVTFHRVGGEGAVAPEQKGWGCLG